MGTKIKRIFKKFQLKRTSVLLLVFIMLSFVLIRQLYQLQIIQGEDYIDEFQTRTTKTRVLKSTRGNIYDRNNKLIASNILSYSLTFEDNGSYDTTREKNLTLNGVAYKVSAVSLQITGTVSLIHSISNWTMMETMYLILSRDLP